MQAAVLHGARDLRIESRPAPDPGPGDVVVEVSHCGVCGTDLHMVIEGWGRPGTVGGHEWSGRVVAVGPGVDDVAVGAAVVGGPAVACGTCAACRDGRPSLCVERGAAGTEGNDGAFARFVRADHRSVMEVHGAMDLRVAALAEPLAVSLHAVTRSSARPGDRVLVSGAGPIGALAVVALRARGITDVVVSEPRRTRRDLAGALGAEVIEPAALETVTVAEPHRVVADPFDAAIECSGKHLAMEAALCQLRRGGTLVLVGTGMQPPTFDPNRILLNELVVTGAYEYDAGGFDEALDILASGELDVATLLAPDDVPLTGLLTAMEDLADGHIAGKVMVAPGLSGDDRRETR